jgi:hypothetical protein
VTAWARAPQDAGTAPAGPEAAPGFPAGSEAAPGFVTGAPAEVRVITGATSGATTGATTDPAGPCRSVHVAGPRPAATPSVIGMRVLVAALAVVVCAGCAAVAGDDWTPPPDDPAPVAGSQGPTPAHASAVPRTQTVRVAAGLRVLVEWPALPDPAQSAMLAALRDFYTGSWRAVATGGRDLSYLEDLEVDVGRQSYDWVRGFLDAKATARGTAHLYGLAVSAVSGDGAQVDACVDESGLRLVDAATGRAAARQPAWTKPPRSVYQYVAAVRREDDGTWRIRALRHAAHPHERAKACLRAGNGPEAAVPSEKAGD